DLQRVLYLYHATDAYSRAAIKLYHDAASALGLVLVAQAVRSEEEAQAKLAQIQKGDVDGILAPLSLALNLPGEILKAAAQRAIPTMLTSMAGFWWRPGELSAMGPAATPPAGRRQRWERRSAKAPAPARTPPKTSG